MQPLEINSFIHRFVAGNFTEAEHQQFIEWLKTAPTTETEKILDLYYSISGQREIIAGDPDPHLVSQIETALDQYALAAHNATRTKSGVFRLHRIARLAAAVLVLFVCTTALWLMLKNTGSKNKAVSTTFQPTVKKQLLPGGNKAILTLSDGSVISLDDAKTGKIARQGNTLIDKTASGQLVYKSLEEKPSEVVYNTLTTPRGGQFKLNLPDGSAVWLNAASSIKYPTAFTGAERKIEMSGEVYFEIAHDASKPFVVAANGMEIKVLGTHFNVNAYSDESVIKTSLLQGSISLSKNGKAVKIYPGQQAQLAFNGNINVVNEVDMDEVIAWKNGYFSFNRANLQTVMRQIARWYDVDIRYEGRIPERLFGGKIDRNSDVADVLKILEESKVHFSIDDKKIIVRP